MRVVVAFVCVSAFFLVSVVPLRSQRQEIYHVLLVHTCMITYLHMDLPQSCGKIATEVDAAHRTPKNPYENLMRENFFSHAYDPGILSIVHMFLMRTTVDISKKKKKLSCAH